MWRNGTKCKYRFIFPLKNLARKGLLKSYAKETTLANSMTIWCNRCVVQQCIGLIKSNRPLYVSVSHGHGIGLSDLKFLRCIAYVIDVLLAKFQIHTMSHIATMSIWTNALFTGQIQVCQLVVEPRNHTAGCVIYVGHVSSIACFYH